MIILYFDFKLFLLPPMHTFIQICLVIVTENVVEHQKYFLLINNTDLVNLLLETYTCQLFFSKLCVRFFVSTESEFLKIYQELLIISEDFERILKITEDFQRLPKIVEDFPTPSEVNRRCRKIFDDFKTGPTFFKGFSSNLEHC